MTNAFGSSTRRTVDLKHEKSCICARLAASSEVLSMPLAKADKLARDIPPLQAPYAPADEDIARVFLSAAARSSEAEARIDARGRRLVEAIRARIGGLGGIEDFLHAYALSTKEGLAL